MFMKFLTFYNYYLALSLSKYVVKLRFAKNKKLNLDNFYNFKTTYFDMYNRFLDIFGFLVCSVLVTLPQPILYCLRTLSSIFILRVICNFKLIKLRKRGEKS